MTAQPPGRTGPRRSALEQRLEELEREREQLIREKRRNLLFAGAAASLLVHLVILWYLGLILRPGGGSGPNDGTAFEFAILPDEELTELIQAELESESPESLDELSEIPETPSDLNLETPPVADLDVLSDGSQLTLGGSVTGGDGDLDLGGGGARVTFHGVEGKGSRFVFIVDVSGSMSESNKFRLAMGELIRSVSSLPDFAHFHVILFETQIHWPPWQEGWVRARVRDVDRLVEWIDSVQPGGGTQPMAAFQRAFALDIPPDVIFFLTDGQIAEESTPVQIAQMNSNRGKRVVINTIAFGDPRAQDMLRRISQESGGAFKFIQIGDQP